VRLVACCADIEIVARELFWCGLDLSSYDHVFVWNWIREERFLGFFS